MQANLVIIPEDYAEEFQNFCALNPKPCPLIEVIRDGFEAQLSAKGSDVRSDVPRYRYFENGQFVREYTDVTELCASYEQQSGSRLVSFLIGCSFTFEQSLLEEGLEIRHITEKRNVPMYTTNQQTTPAGRFSGPLVVSMRPFRRAQVDRVIAVTSAFERMHGAPIHFSGNYEELGIADLHKPDFGDAVTVDAAEEIPVFWACGVTPQMALLKGAPPFAVTHSPGCMFVTDLSNADFQDK